MTSDDASVYLGPVTPGTGAVLQNSQCAIDVAGVTVTGAGTAVTMTVPVTFKATFAGAKLVFTVMGPGLVRDLLGGCRLLEHFAVHIELGANQPQFPRRRRVGRGDGACAGHGARIRAGL